MGWDDTFVSTCVNGFWIFYEYTYYDTYNEGNAWYAYGTDYCIDMPWDVQRTVSSVNYAGRGEGIDWDSLNLYQHDWFKGFKYSTKWLKMSGLLSNRQCQRALNF